LAGGISGNGCSPAGMECYGRSATLKDGQKKVGQLAYVPTQIEAAGAAPAIYSFG